MRAPRRGKGGRGVRARGVGPHLHSHGERPVELGRVPQIDSAHVLARWDGDAEGEALRRLPMMLQRVGNSRRSVDQPGALRARREGGGVVGKWVRWRAARRARQSAGRGRGRGMGGAELAPPAKAGEEAGGVWRLLVSCDIVGRRLVWVGGAGAG
eukprot:scaffold11654_cov65-Isochrysis_galbana.AAC.2